MIESKKFIGSKPPTYRKDQDAAMQELNEWRKQNAMVRIINIETLVEQSSMLTSGGGFQGFIVWYET